MFQRYKLSSSDLKKTTSETRLRDLCRQIHFKSFSEDRTFSSPWASAHLLSTKEQRDLKCGCPLIRTTDFPVSFWNHRSVDETPYHQCLPSTGEKKKRKAGAVRREGSGWAGNAVLDPEPCFRPGALVRSVCLRPAEPPPRTHPLLASPRAHASSPGRSYTAGSASEPADTSPHVLVPPKRQTSAADRPRRGRRRPVAEHEAAIFGLGPSPAAEGGWGTARFPRCASGRGAAGPPLPSPPSLRGHVAQPGAASHRSRLHASRGKRPANPPPASHGTPWQRLGRRWAEGTGTAPKELRIGYRSDPAIEGEPPPTVQPGAGERQNPVPCRAAAEKPRRSPAPHSPESSGRRGLPAPGSRLALCPIPRPGSAASRDQRAPVSSRPLTWRDRGRTWGRGVAPQDTWRRRRGGRCRYRSFAPHRDRVPSPHRPRPKRVIWREGEGARRSPAKLSGVGRDPSSPGRGRAPAAPAAPPSVFSWAPGEAAVWDLASPRRVKAATSYISSVSKSRLICGFQGFELTGKFTASAYSPDLFPNGFWLCKNSLENSLEKSHFSQHQWQQCWDTAYFRRTSPTQKLTYVLHSSHMPRREATYLQSDSRHRSTSVGKKKGGRGGISTSSVDGQQKPEVKRRELCSRNAHEVRLSTHSWLKGQLYDVLDLSFIH